MFATCSTQCEDVTHGYIGKDKDHHLSCTFIIPKFFHKQFVFLRRHPVWGCSQALPVIDIYVFHRDLCAQRPSAHLKPLAGGPLIRSWGADGCLAENSLVEAR